MFKLIQKRKIWHTSINQKMIRFNYICNSNKHTHKHSQTEFRSSERDREMELDVHLKREGPESWGFRLIGGKDFNMPLTVVKVLPDSPADRAGLQNGDAVFAINDRDTTVLSHDSAKQAVDDALDTLKVSVKRGLYDPVLDDYEPIYEPVDQGDFDQPSQPTEEEILEIGRKSSLLASAIDETIKCIEEYKEEVGIDITTQAKSKEFTKTEMTVSNSIGEHETLKQETNVESPNGIYNDHMKAEIIVYNNFQNPESKIDAEWNHIDEQLKNSNEKLSELSIKMSGEITESELNIEPSLERNELTEPATVQESQELVETKRIETSTEEQTDRMVINETSDSSFAVKFSPETKFENTDADDTSSVLLKIAEKKDPLEGYRPIKFNPEELLHTKNNLQRVYLSVQESPQRVTSPSYMDATGDLLGTHQGIVDGLREAVVDSEVAKELGKPGITEEKIAELISGESEMLREAHVMGLSRVLKSHMHRTDDDSSVDFKKIKPIIESLKDSEVLKALNEEMLRVQEEKKKKEEQKKWTTFLQKPQRPVPRAKFGYYGYIEPEQIIEEPYKVKIVKQPKPKVAPDYKPEDFETGPLPWEERALNEPPPPPVNAEDPILVPEDVPEFLEAVDPLPESEVPDLEETGIPLPQPQVEEEISPAPTPEIEEEETEDQPETLDIEAVVDETEKIVAEMEQNRLAEQLLTGVQNMVDPNASVEQQLAQMRAQLAALAQLPLVIQNTLEHVTRQLTHLTHQESQQMSLNESQSSQMGITVESQERECIEETDIQTNGDAEEVEESKGEQENVPEDQGDSEPPVAEEQTKTSMTEEERQKLKEEEKEMLEEQQRIEKQKKELMEQMRLEQESRQVKQRPTPRVGKPKPVFGPPVPVERPLVLPGGRRWRKPQDAYNEQFIAETLTAQAEIIQGKAKGSFESDILPYDERLRYGT